jgi:hypothetical protein
VVFLEDSKWVWNKNNGRTTIDTCYDYIELFPHDNTSEASTSITPSTQTQGSASITQPSTPTSPTNGNDQSASPSPNQSLTSNTPPIPSPLPHTNASTSVTPRQGGIARA